MSSSSHVDPSIKIDQNVYGDQPTARDMLHELRKTALLAEPFTDG